MTRELEAEAGHRILFTAPWEPIVVRRGDALGLRALVDQFAEAIAPGLSNRVRDGRWVTILAWCLARSQEVFHASGGRSVATRAQQRDRYAWLRPLELMWVARTIGLAKDWQDRPPLAGQRRVRQWYEDDDKSTNRFGLSLDQFRAYRQTGMYGGYRLAFRKWRAMTVQGDGWTPGPATNRLAKWLDKRLGTARPSWPLHIGEGDDDSLSTRSAKLRRGDEHSWWLQRWTTFDRGGRGADDTLPRRKDDFTILPEVDLLRPLIFEGDPFGTRRIEVAREVWRASASDHIEVCEHLSRVFHKDRAITLLPRFSRLADAGIEAMNLVAKFLRNESRVAIADVAALPEAAPICEELVAAAREWLKKGGQIELDHIETAHRFARAVGSAQPIDCLRALLLHHEVYGGGLRWFVLRNGRVEPRSPPRSGSSYYRFRLWSLCRLATQCGVLRYMPRVLRLDDEAEDDDTSEGANE